MTGDISRGSDLATLGVGHGTGDSARWHAHAHVDKYDDDQVRWVESRLGVVAPQGRDFELLRVRPYDTADAAGNLVTTAGWTRLTSLMIAGGGQALTNTATRLGVGNGVTAAAIGNTDLAAAAGAANRYFYIMDATYPSVATNVLTMRSTFATGDANFVWAEWGSDVAAPTVANSAVVGATLVNRAVQALGTKASGAWTLTAQITFT